MRPNQSLQPTANPLRGLSAAELGRYVSGGGVVTSEATYQHDYSGCSQPRRIGEVL